MHKQNYFAYIVVVQICELDSDLIHKFGQQGVIRAIKLPQLVTKNDFNAR